LIFFKQLIIHETEKKNTLNKTLSEVR